ncbi:hypothetical protein PMAYCL1PPCAC_04979, partial [Pristionchus mayeri]
SNIKLKNYRRNSVHCDVLADAELRMRTQGGLFTLSGDGSHDTRSADFLSLLERMQSQRLDDQRCEMPEIHVS